jgi:spore maturation protein CgeB
MRFVIVSSGYLQFLQWLYRDARANLAEQTFAEQRQAYYATLFATSDFYAHGLQILGHQVEEFIYNCDPMQLAWRRENLRRSATGGVESQDWEPNCLTPARQSDANQHLLEWLSALKRATAETSIRRWLAPVVRPLLTRFYDSSVYGFRLLVEQVRRNKPDVLFIQTLYTFDNDQLRELKRHAGMLVGEQAVMPIADHIDYRNYDLIVSSFPPIVDSMRARGVRAELNRLAFDPRVDRLIPKTKRDTPLSFVGSVFPMHSSRLVLLEAVAEKVPTIEVYGNVTIAVGPDSSLRGHIHPPLWGRDMYRLLRRSQITLNHHGDVLPYANNMRMYEATGMGCLLVTDYKDNLGEMFEPEKEVVTYKSAEECVDKLRFYLDDRNAAAREAIMAAGHRRTLTEHTYDARMRDLLSLIEARRPS